MTVDVVAFAALGWESRLVLEALVGVERIGERRWLGYLGDGASCQVLQTGVGPVRAEAAARSAPAARLFVVAGCGGGMQPSLTAGDVVVGTHVGGVRGDRDRVRLIDAPLAAWATRRGQTVSTGGLVSSPVVLATPAAKQAAGRGGAMVVDMESLAIARVAEQRGIPTAVVRGVLDPLADAVPLGFDAIDPESGNLRRGRAALAVLGRPGRWPATWRLAHQRRAVERRLRPVLAVLFGGGLEAFGLTARVAAGLGVAP